MSHHGCSDFAVCIKVTEWVSGEEQQVGVTIAEDGRKKSKGKQSRKKKWLFQQSLAFPPQEMVPCGGLLLLLGTNRVKCVFFIACRHRERQH